MTDIITAGQIGKIQEDLGAALRKSELPRNPVQQVIEEQSVELTKELVAVIQKRVAALTGMTSRQAKVDRTRSNRGAIAATCRRQYVTDSVVDGMPRGESEDATIVYFKPAPDAYKSGLISCERLAQEYELRGLKPDPQAQAADNEADPAFADGTPNACQWVDAGGKYCYAAFGRWGGRRNVSVYRYDSGWSAFWSFGGVRK